jgi:uncharacterized membrane protein
MQTITRDIVVNAPQQQVCSFLVDPHNLAEIWPSIEEVKSVKKTRNNSGFKFNWLYKMAGVPFEGKCETIEYTPYERIVIKSTKGLDSTMTWSLKPVPGEQQTHVTLTFDYQSPASILKQMEEAALAQENEREVDVMLRNLRNRLELEPAHV